MIIKISDRDFRIAVVEIVAQAREASKAWARLRSRLDDGPAKERPVRLQAVREAYYKLSTMRYRVLSVVGALTGTLPIEAWIEGELTALPALLEAARNRKKG